MRAAVTARYDSCYAVYVAELEGAVAVYLRYAGSEYLYLRGVYSPYDAVS